MKLKLLFNPSAGRGRARKQIERVAAHLSRLGAAVDVHSSSSSDDLTRVAAESSRGGYDRVVVCGGDGTVNLAVRDFDLERGTLAVIPLGSGNDFARVTNIPRKVEQACAVAIGQKTRLVDVGRANDTRFVGVAGLGFDSEVTKYANERAPRFLRGSAVYLYSIVRVLPRFKPHRIRMMIDGHPRDQSVMMVAIGNSWQYGGGIRIVPDAIIDDGFLDFCIVRETSRAVLLKTLPLAYTGKHVRSHYVETGRAKKLHFETDRRLDVYADGERVTTTPVRFSVEEKKLRVVVP